MSNVRNFDGRRYSPAQVKAARALLGVSMRQLAEAAGLTVAQIRRAERGAALDITAGLALGRALYRDGLGILPVEEARAGEGVRWAMSSSDRAAREAAEARKLEELRAKWDAEVRKWLLEEATDSDGHSTDSATDN